VFSVVKAATARARKAKEQQKKGAGSQLQTNAKASNIICNVCKQTFMCTAKQQTLQEHLDKKHAKLSLNDCFPDFVAA